MWLLKKNNNNKYLSIFDSHMYLILLLQVCVPILLLKFKNIYTVDKNIIHYNFYITI